MKIDQLIYFLETAKTQHIGKASRIINVSPSAISHSIAALEEELGQPLFEKIGKAIYLTEQGRTLAQKVEPVLASLNRIKEEIQSENVMLEGNFKLGATHGLADLFIAPALMKFAKEHPKVVFEFHSLRSAQVIEGVARGDLDFGICFGPLPTPSITIHHLRKEKLVIAVKKNHPLCKMRGNNLLRELSCYPLALPKAFAGIEICEQHPALMKLRIPVKPSFLYDSYDVAASTVAHSLYWTLIPELFLNSKLSLLSIPDFEASTEICAVTPKGRRLPGAIHQWLTHLN